MGGKFLLRCNFDVSKLPINVPAFYKGCLHSWSSLVKWTNETTVGVLQQPIWNNKFVCIQNKSVYYSCFKNVGLVTIGDMLSQTGTFLGYDELESKGIKPSEYFRWMGIIHSLPKEWRLLLRTLNVNSFPSRTATTTNIDLESTCVVIDGDSVDIQQLTSKKVYRSLITSKAKEPSSKLKFTEDFPDEHLDWKTIYRIPFLTTIDTRTRSFQFKILHKILFTNSNLFKMKLVPSPLCTFIGLEGESPEHIFCECGNIKDFWNDFVVWVNFVGLSLVKLE